MSRFFGVKREREKEILWCVGKGGNDLRNCWMHEVQDRHENWVKENCVWVIYDLGKINYLNEKKLYWICQKIVSSRNIFFQRKKNKIFKSREFFFSPLFFLYFIFCLIFFVPIGDNIAKTFLSVSIGEPSSNSPLPPRLGADMWRGLLVEGRAGIAREVEGRRTRPGDVGIGWE